jgi:hypothetical protein
MSDRRSPSSRSDASRPDGATTFTPPHLRRKAKQRSVNGLCLGNIDGRAGTIVARTALAGVCHSFSSRGLDVTSTRRFTLMLAAVAAFTLTSSIPIRAQIIYPYPPYGYGAIRPDASVRVDVTPRDAEVYVDGYYAGVVRDFNGVFSRLHVEPGQHEITIYHDGYRSIQQRVYLTRDRTFKIKQAMEMLPAGEAAEARPIPAPLPAGAQPPLPLPGGGSGGRGGRGGRAGRGAPPNLPPPNAPPPVDSSAPAGQAATGRLTIQVQPADASVLIDGQPWPASPGQDTVVLDLSEGSHVVQVRKPGYVGYLTEAEVRRGATTTVNVTLRTQP